MSPDKHELVNLTTGTVAPPDVQRDCMAAHAIGEAAYEEFTVRLNEDTQEKFYYFWQCQCQTPDKDNERRCSQGLQELIQPHDPR